MPGVIIPAAEIRKPRPMHESGWLEKTLKNSGIPDVGKAFRQELPNGDMEYANKREDLSKLE